MSDHVWRRGAAGFPIRDVDGLELMGEKVPAVLYGRGDRPDAFDAPRVAIVGTRAATPAGLADAHELGRFCARAGVTVVSGLAIGIDAAAHEGALDGGGLTVGVVATDLDTIYPRRHGKLYARVQAHGLIVGEHAERVHPEPWRFPIRNRIIAALADIVVVVEATLSGGARITAHLAIDYSRKVYAVPGSRRNPSAAGCNALIAIGAVPLLDPSDMLVGLGFGTAEVGWQRVNVPLVADERRALRAMAGDGASIDALERASKLDAARLGAALRGLERKGRVSRKRGLWWPT
ncbi:MAG TPA: DNA-processing protein DprA [Acidimicrobiia bacterium]|nr:DNA-processing protein DprA [Acidimicrobiia bacterium]